MMATHEYEGLKEQLDLEQNLRQKAETYAHEVANWAKLLPPKELNSVPGSHCSPVNAKTRAVH